MEAGFELVAGYAELLARGDVISYNSAISACEKGQQWKQALSLLPEVRSSSLAANVVSYKSASSACEKGQQRSRP